MHHGTRAGDSAAAGPLPFQVSAGVQRHQHCPEIRLRDTLLRSTVSPHQMRRPSRSTAADSIVRQQWYRFDCAIGAATLGRAASSPHSKKVHQLNLQCLSPRLQRTPSHVRCSSAEWGILFCTFGYFGQFRKGLCPCTHLRHKKFIAESFHSLTLCPSGRLLASAVGPC